MMCSWRHKKHVNCLWRWWWWLRRNKKKNNRQRSTCNRVHKSSAWMCRHCYGYVALGWSLSVVCVLIFSLVWISWMDGRFISFGYEFLERPSRFACRLLNHPKSSVALVQSLISNCIFSIALFIISSLTECSMVVLLLFFFHAMFIANRIASGTQGNWMKSMENLWAKVRSFRLSAMSQLKILIDKMRFRWFIFLLSFFFFWNA